MFTSAAKLRDSADNQEVHPRFATGVTEEHISQSFPIIILFLNVQQAELYVMLSTNINKPHTRLKETRIRIGFPAATGRGSSTRARVHAPTAFRRRNSSGMSRSQKAVGFGFQLSLNRDGSLVFLCAPCMAQERQGGNGGAAGFPKHGAVCADRLAKKRIARASGVFIGTAATFSLPIC